MYATCVLLLLQRTRPPKFLSLYTAAAATTLSHCTATSTKPPTRKGPIEKHRQRQSRLWLASTRRCSSTPTRSAMHVPSNNGTASMSNWSKSRSAAAWHSASRCQPAPSTRTEPELPCWGSPTRPQGTQRRRGYQRARSGPTHTTGLPAGAQGPQLAHPSPAATAYVPLEHPQSPLRTVRPKSASPHVAGHALADPSPAAAHCLMHAARYSAGGPSPAAAGHCVLPTAGGPFGLHIAQRTMPPVPIQSPDAHGVAQRRRRGEPSSSTGSSSQRPTVPRCRMPAAPHGGPLSSIDHSSDRPAGPRWHPRCRMPTAAQRAAAVMGACPLLLIALQRRWAALPPGL